MHCPTGRHSCAGAEVLLVSDRLDEAFLEVEKLERSNNEPNWEHYFMFWLVVITTRLQVHSKREDRGRFDQVFTEASAFREVLRQK